MCQTRWWWRCAGGALRWRLPWRCLVALVQRPPQQEVGSSPLESPERSAADADAESADRSEGAEPSERSDDCAELGRDESGPSSESRGGGSNTRVRQVGRAAASPPRGVGRTLRMKGAGPIGRPIGRHLVRVTPPSSYLLLAMSAAAAHEPRLVDGGALHNELLQRCLTASLAEEPAGPPAAPTPPRTPPTQSRGPAGARPPAPRRPTGRGRQGARWAMDAACRRTDPDRPAACARCATCATSRVSRRGLQPRGHAAAGSAAGHTAAAPSVDEA